MSTDHLLERATFKVAKSMLSYPHSYTLRETWENDSEFVEAVLFIREHGIRERFYYKTYIYYYLNEYKYWTMGNPVSYTDKTKTFIINRAKISSDT